MASKIMCQEADKYILISCMYAVLQIGIFVKKKKQSTECFQESQNVIF